MIKETAIDEKTSIDLEKLAKALSEFTPEVRKIIIGQMKASLVTCQVLKPYLKDNPFIEDTQEQR